MDIIEIIIVVLILVVVILIAIKLLQLFSKVQITGAGVGDNSGNGSAVPFCIFSRAVVVNEVVLGSDAPGEFWMRGVDAAVDDGDTVAAAAQPVVGREGIGLPDVL